MKLQLYKVRDVTGLLSLNTQVCQSVDILQRLL